MLTYSIVELSMDERVEKAFTTANYMATLSNQRRIIAEEFKQKLVFYKNGGTFEITPNLIVFINTLLTIGQTEDVAFIDANNFPVIIKDVQEFFDDVTSIYFSAINEYATKFAEIKSKRTVKDIVGL
jgi:hypothetical protein